MLKLDNVSKTFTNGKGIFDVNLTVNKGETFGFLGPNGAGKSTTIRHLMGFIKPEKGTAFINNLNTWDHASDVQSIVGYLPGEISFLDHMTGMDFLNLMGKMRKSAHNHYRDELIKRFEFDVHTPIRKMSKGMKQKVGIVAAFMHKPDVLILDEPTSGLDPLMQQVFVDLLLEEKKRGVTIFMSSHIFSEIEKVCDRISIIKDGRIVATEPIHEIRKNKTQTFTVSLSSAEDVNYILQSPLHAQLDRKHDVHIIVKGNFDEFFRVLSAVHVVHMTSEEEHLEQLFMNYYRQGENEK
ncbi:ABC transporter ATP-binding protein [Priestia megaterium]|nr:ABC transporter ATP-binding protein [Priestia megaterium]